MDHDEEGTEFRENKTSHSDLQQHDSSQTFAAREGGREGGEGEREMPDKDEYSPLVSLLKSKASTIKV